MGQEGRCLDSAHRAGERHHLHSAGAALPERRCRGAGGGAARVDVVDEAHAGRRCARRREGAANVAPALLQAEPSLALDRARAPDERRDRQLPDAAELAWRAPRPAGDPGAAPAPRRPGRTRARARPAATSVSATIAAASRARRRCPCSFHACTNRRAGCVVDDRGPRGGERDPPAAALGAAPHRPGAGRAAAIAERRRQPDQRVVTARAEARTRARRRRRTGSATGRRGALPRPYGGSRVTGVSRIRDDCARSRARTRPARAGPALGGACCRRRAAAPCRRCRASIPANE